LDEATLNVEIAYRGLTTTGELRHAGFKAVVAEREAEA
jgi:hypothetical protein